MQCSFWDLTIHFWTKICTQDYLILNLQQVSKWLQQRCYNEQGNKDIMTAIIHSTILSHPLYLWLILLHSMFLLHSSLFYTSPADKIVIGTISFEPCVYITKSTVSAWFLLCHSTIILSKLELNHISFGFSFPS